MKKFTIVCLAALVLVGCGTTTQKKETPQQNIYAENPEALRQTAAGLIQAWLKAPTPDKLVNALALFEKAHNLQPDDANIQLQYYKALSMATLLAQPGAEQKLMVLFQKLNPAVREISHSPGRVLYNREVTENTPSATKLYLVKSYLKRYPKDAYLFNEYARLMLNDDQPWFASALAKRAVDLAPETAKYAYMLGVSLDEASYTTDCYYDHPNLLKQSVKYFLKASQLEPENPDHFEEATYQYLRLGLAPIAYQQASKAFDLEQNTWTLQAKLAASFHMKKYEEVTELSETNFKKPAMDTNPTYYAAVKAMQKDWRASAEAYAKISWKTNLSEQIMKLWLDAIASQNRSIDFTTLRFNDDAWSEATVAYLKSTGGSALIEQATDTCQNAEAHFFTALKAWQNGEMEAVKTHLQKVTTYRATTFVEHRWAIALLKGFFDA